MTKNSIRSVDRGEYIFDYPRVSGTDALCDWDTSALWKKCQCFQLFLHEKNQ